MIRKGIAILLAFMLIIPLVPKSSYADMDTRNVRVNQIGYLPGASKIATIISASASPLDWTLQSSTGATAVTGKTTVRGQDIASGDILHHADFSSVTQSGTFTLQVTGVGVSVPFIIGGSLYPDLPREAMEYFYFHRMGIDIEANYLSNPAFAHKALHPNDNQIGCYNNWCAGNVLNVKNSWADAGDLGIYPVNHAISAWTLLNLLERYPTILPDGSLNIPEKANGIPDILDEVNFGSTFMRGMLPATGGLASHKVHGDSWSAFPLTNIDSENAMTRQAQPPSTNATYAVARNSAQLARLLKPYNNALATELWTTAKTSWTRALANPNVDYTGATADYAGGGDYDDTKNSDDQYAAAAEMYLTAYALNDAGLTSYRSAVTGSIHYKEVGSFDWGEVAATGTLSLLTVANELSVSDKIDMKNNLLTYANGLVTTLAAEGYPVSLPGSTSYPWGSNSTITNQMMMLAYAYDLSSNVAYLKSMYRVMDYLMGNNAMKLSYVTGYGEYYETDTHDRWAWGKYQSGNAYPKGWLSGGPNNGLINDTATPTGKPAAKSYAGKDTAPSAWCSKENTINWNAPLVWVAQYMKDHESVLNSGGSNVQPPNAPASLNATAGNAQVTLSWAASVGATSYTIKRATLDGGPYTNVAVGVTPSSFTNTGLTNGTTYYYVVSAMNSAGESANSLQTSAVPIEGTTTTSALALQYKTGDTNATDNQMKPHFMIKNNGTTSVSLSSLTLRYYFTKDGSQSLNATVDWAQIGNSNVKAVFANSSGTNADTYLELSFTAGAGSIAAGGQSGDIQLRINKADWSNFNEANDYSFSPTLTTYTNWDKVTLYQNGTLVWGIAP